MIWLRGISMSLVAHAVAATIISVNAAIPIEAPTEDVAAIPVELVLEVESARVAPAAPDEQVVEAAPDEKPAEEGAKAEPAPEKMIEPVPEFNTASLPPTLLPPVFEPVTEQKSPVKSPPAAEETPKPAPPEAGPPLKAAEEKSEPEAAVPKIGPKAATKKRPVTKLQKLAAKRIQSGQRKQVAALAAGKGSVGRQRSTDGRAAEQNYSNKVLARLRAAKKYPAGARGKGIEGTAILSFTISASGSLTSACVVKGAGHALLDSAVLAMARNAAPFPAFPQTITKSQMSFRVPIKFKIN